MHKVTDYKKATKIDNTVDTVKAVRATKAKILANNREIGRAYEK